MATTSTYLNFPFDAELFMQAWGQAPDPVKLAFLNSGVLVNDPTIQAEIAGNGNFYTIPFYNILSGDPVNYDGATDITSTETTADYQSGIVYGRAKGFTARNFAAELSGADPFGNIVNKVAHYWDKQYQTRVIGLLGGIFGVTTGNTDYTAGWATHSVDLSSSTATPSVIEANTINTVMTDTVGDNKDKFRMAIMHSQVAKTLENLQLLEYWKYTDANGVQRPMNLASCNGLTVLVDDTVPNAVVGGSGANADLTTYTTYLLGEGALLTADARVDVPVEVHRDPAKNGGQDTLYTRKRETIHPNGFSFVVPSSGFTNSPTDSQLFASANWNIKFDPKAIPMAKIITNG